MATPPHSNDDEDAGSIAHTSFCLDFEKGRHIPATWSYSASKTTGHERPLGLCFTHGAGGDHHAAVMEHFVRGAAEVLPVLRFSGNANLANRVKRFQAVVQACFHSQKQQQQEGHPRPEGVVLGGRSLGARAAAAAFSTEDSRSSPIRSRLVLQSYPLYGAKSSSGNNKSEVARREVLQALPSTAQVLFVAGSADRLCPLAQLEEVRKAMAAESWLLVVRGADHGLDVPKGLANGDGRRRLVQAAGRLAAAWCCSDNSSSSGRECEIWMGEDGKDVQSTGWRDGRRQGGASAAVHAEEGDEGQDRKRRRL